MFRRGMTSLALAASVLFAVGMPGAMAASATITKNDTHGIFFQLADGSVSGGAEIGKQGGVAFSQLAIFKFIITNITCADGATRNTLTTFRGISTPTAIKISMDLKSGSASGTVSGQQDVYNDCTQTDALTDMTFSVTMNFHSTSGITTSKSHTVTKFPDGSKDVFDDRFDSRDAVGTVAVGDTSYSPELNSIVHEVSTDVLTPAPSHH